MTSPRRRGPALSTLVFRLTAVALASAVLIWSAMFVGTLRKRTESASAASTSDTQLASPDNGATAPAPAPLTSRTS